MELKLLTPLEKLNNSYYNKTLTCQGIVTELSSEFEDYSYGSIQTGSLQSLKKDYQQIGVQKDINIILPGKFAGLVSLGEKVQISGTLIAYNPHDSKSINRAILVKNIKIINDERLDNLSEKEIKDIESIAKQSLVQQKLANNIFGNILLNQDIKLIGTLILFCADSPYLVEKKIHCHISLLITGSSATYKTSFLKAFKKLLPNDIFYFSQKSDKKFITYNSRYKKGGEFCKKAGLADLAKNGIILIDNLGELKEYTLFNLKRDFIKILRKTSIISAVHTKNERDSLLKKFDLVLITNNKPFGSMYNYGEEGLLEKEINEGDTLISKDLLKKYIKYAKSKFDPRFTERAGNRIIKFKEEMIKINKDKDKFRKLDSVNLIRVLTILSKAYARIALKNNIELKDVQPIIRIYKQHLINLDLI